MPMCVMILTRSIYYQCISPLTAICRQSCLPLLWSPTYNHSDLRPPGNLALRPVYLTVKMPRSIELTRMYLDLK